MTFDQAEALFAANFRRDFGKEVGDTSIPVRLLMTRAAPGRKTHLMAVLAFDNGEIQGDMAIVWRANDRAEIMDRRWALARDTLGGAIIAERDRIIAAHRQAQLDAAHAEAPAAVDASIDQMMGGRA